MLIHSGEKPREYSLSDERSAQTLPHVHEILCMERNLRDAVAVGKPSVISPGSPTTVHKGKTL